MTNVTALKPDTDQFEQFWQAYPSCRRIDKALCRAKFEAITSPAGLSTRMLDKDSGRYVDAHMRATAAEIIAGAKKYDRSQPLRDYDYAEPQYIRHPATWLNRGGWED